MKHIHQRDTLKLIEDVFKHCSSLLPRFCNFTHSYKEEWFDKGLVQGIEQGIEKGIEEGEEKKAIEIANNMLKSNLEPKLISSVTGLSIDALQKLKASL